MRHDFPLDGKVCVLTGATGGIGQALARALAGAGCRLVLCGRKPEQLERLGATLPAQAVVATCSGSLTETSTQARLARCASEHAADVLINLAGVNQLQAFEHMSSTALTQLVNTNLLLPMEVTRQLLPILQCRPTAMIANVGSVFGSIGHPGYVAYSASKFGLRGFSEALGRELADTPVRVVHISPRATQTTMNDGRARALNQRLGNREDPPEQVAQQILKAMQAGRSLTTLGWPERAFVFINQLLPAIVDKALNANLTTIKAAFPNPTPQEQTP